MQNAVNKFFRAVGRVWEVGTASAYSQARQKVQPEVFVHLNAVACEEYYARYEEDQALVLWHGPRVWGVEGSYRKLPDTEETRRKFSVQTNPHQGGEQGQALASGLYDSCNAVGLSAGLGPKQAEKNVVFGTPLAVTQAGDVVVCARAYADYRVMATLVARQCHFVIRLPRQRVTAVTAVWAAPEQACVVTLEVTSKARADVTAHYWPTTLQVRLVQVLLASGDVAVLGTDWLDARTYPAAEFNTVYGWRWHHET